MTFGRNVMIDSFSLLIATADSPITIGDYVHIGSHVSIGGAPVILESFTNIGPGSRLLAGSDSFAGDALIGASVPAAYRKVNRSGIDMMQHSVVGANVVVFPGVILYPGAAVGAGSVVLQDVEQWSIYAGCPAKYIKERNKGIILQLAERLRGLP